MLFKVELEDDVKFFLRHRCSPAERRAFYDALEAVRKEPISHSEAILKPDISPYMLRTFKFRGVLAIFEFDPLKGITVLECERVPIKRRGPSNGR